MLADNRTAIINAQNELTLKIEEVKKDQHLGFKMLSEWNAVHGDDIGKVQAELRKQGDELDKHTQALDGLTQLCKSAWDLTESLQRHVHAEHEEDVRHVHGEGSPT